MPHHSRSQRSDQRTVLIDEAAHRLGVSRRTVYYRIGDGRLQTIRTRSGTQRVLVSSIEDLLRHQQAAARARVNREAPLSEPEALTLQVEPLPGDA